MLFVFGMLARFDYVPLPDALALIEHDYVLWASGIMLVANSSPTRCVVRLGMGRVAHVHPHPGGIALAWGALGDHGPAAQFARR